MYKRKRPAAVVADQCVKQHHIFSSYRYNWNKEMLCRTFEWHLIQIGHCCFDNLRLYPLLCDRKFLLSWFPLSCTLLFPMPSLLTSLEPSSAQSISCSKWCIISKKSWTRIECMWAWHFLIEYHFSQFTAPLKLRRRRAHYFTSFLIITNDGNCGKSKRYQ